MYVILLILREIGVGGFQLQQQPFLLYATREPSQRAVAAYDTMTGYEDADAIGAYGLCHCSDAFTLAHLLCYILVAPGLRIGYAEQGPPHLLLESSSYEM